MSRVEVRPSGSGWSVALDGMWLASFGNKADADTWAEAKRAEIAKAPAVPRKRGLRARAVNDDCTCGHTWDEHDLDHGMACCVEGCDCIHYEADDE